jgi:Rrf2 family protein
MKLSTRARYALHSMITITRLSGEAGEPVSLGEVAKRTHISRRYLDQLAAALRNATLLRSVSGRGGGYTLARRPEDISIGQIVEASIGPVNIVDCVRQPLTCLKSDQCECRWLYSLINNRITAALDEYSLADLVKKNWVEKMKHQMSADRGEMV